jgi:NAD(P)-dependent dehydrogenase (short-subunit alcohol dehydrogenase family)
MTANRFEGRIAVVTGGASGIGRACVERLAREGAQVVLADWHEKRGRATTDELVEGGLRVQFHLHDAGDEASWRELSDLVRVRFGLLHVLVNNAYSGVAVTFDQATPQALRDAMRVNAEGVLLGMQAAAALMRDGGAIVNVSSIAAFYPSQSNLGYATAKMATIQLTGSAALALGKRTPPIRVNAVAPGAVNTPTLRSAIRAFNKLGNGPDGNDGSSRFASDAVLNRIGEPEELASAICFLASNEASFITGQCLRVDGGVFR